jgi:hypothetical protein
MSPRPRVKSEMRVHAVALWGSDAGEAGKREIARSLWGLELPDPKRVDWTIGRLILWCNDLLLALLGEGFRHQQHAADFLWWAKDKA